MTSGIPFHAGFLGRGQDLIDSGPIEFTTHKKHLRDPGEAVEIARGCGCFLRLMDTGEDTEWTPGT